MGIDQLPQATLITGALIEMSVKSEIINIGVIGAGARACVANAVLKLSPQLKMTKIYDPDEQACKRWIAESGSTECMICSSEQEIFSDPQRKRNQVRRNSWKRWNRQTRGTILPPLKMPLHLRPF